MDMPVIRRCPVAATSCEGYFWGYRYRPQSETPRNGRLFLHDFESVPGSQKNNHILLISRLTLKRLSGVCHDSVQCLSANKKGHLTTLRFGRATPAPLSGTAVMMP